MKRPSAWAPLLTAFTIWFLHFMVCWAASELVWPHRRTANVAAWVATAITLLTLFALALHQRRLHASGALLGWHYRFAQGAAVLATVAVAFSALPAVVLRA
jgi:hypothetical protein